MKTLRVTVQYGNNELNDIAQFTTVDENVHKVLADIGDACATGGLYLISGRKSVTAIPGRSIRRVDIDEED